MHSRKSLLAQVHMARKALALPEDAYRSMLSELFGVESSAKLSMPKLLDLVRHFEKLGWVPKRKAAPRPEVHPLCKRIWAQCYALKRPATQYADALAKKLYGVDKLTWLSVDQLKGVTAALAKQEAREGHSPKDVAP